MNNIDEILDWISNLKTLIFKRMEDGFTVTNEGEFRDLQKKIVGEECKEPTLG
jgi:hypothetical protein